MGVGTVKVVDSTLREGDQAPGVWLDSTDKTHIFKQLDAAGVAIVDAGMPAISADERGMLRHLCGLPGRRAEVGASVRCRIDDIKGAAACGVDGVFLIFPVSDLHRKRLGLNRTQWAQMGKEAVEAARQSGLRPYLVMEDASRATKADLEDAIDIAKDYGAVQAIACDTVGVLTPSKAAALIGWLVSKAGADLDIGVHFHDDFGMATANTIAAVNAGARFPGVTVNGIGERAGNASLAEVAAACEQLMGVKTGISLASMQPLSDLVQSLTGVLRRPNAPIVGRRTYDHESGIHVDGLLKDRRTYEPIEPETFGRKRRIVIGKSTGRAGLAHFATQQGVELGDAQLTEALATLKSTRPSTHRATIEEAMAWLDTWYGNQDAQLEEAASNLLTRFTEKDTHR